MSQCGRADRHEVVMHFTDEAAAQAILAKI